VSVAGLLLAAGAGRRMGGPKALLRDARGVPYVDRAIGVLFAGGCDTVTVVLGASAREARKVLETCGWGADPALTTVLAVDWADGMGASLRAGLRALSGSTADAALVTLVDLPDVDERVVARLLEVDAGPASLARATYDGRPGHPVLLGREHWPAAAGTALGDQGARDYLAQQEARTCECSDLATGRDVDTTADL
jgi:CTP:molybdopterin cytidylyltransferase MocA